MKITKEAFSQAAKGSKIVDGKNQDWVFADDPCTENTPTRLLIPPKGFLQLKEGEELVSVTFTTVYRQSGHLVDESDGNYTTLSDEKARLVA